MMQQIKAVRQEHRVSLRVLQRHTNSNWRVYLLFSLLFSSEASEQVSLYRAQFYLHS